MVFAQMIPYNIVSYGVFVFIKYNTSILIILKDIYVCTVQHKTFADSELQENWWRKFWRLIIRIIVHYYNLQCLVDNTLLYC